jgi:hypothetical protein
LVIVGLAIGFIFLNEMVFTASISFFMGLRRREVINMGATLLGRGEDAILFASVGGGLKDPTGAHLLPQGMKLYPFAGGLCLIMSLITPKVMKVSPRIADRLADSIPEWLRYGGVLIQRTLAVEMAPNSHRRYGRSVALGVTMVLFFVSLLGLIMTFQEDLVMRLPVLGAALLFWGLLALSIRARLRHLAEGVKLAGLSMMFKDRRVLVDYVSNTLSLLLLMGLLIVALSPTSLLVALLMPMVFIPAVLWLSKSIHRRTVTPPYHMTAIEMLQKGARISGKDLPRRRRRDQW